MYSNAKSQEQRVPEKASPASRSWFVMVLPLHHDEPLVLSNSPRPEHDITASSPVHLADNKSPVGHTGLFWLFRFSVGGPFLYRAPLLVPVICTTNLGRHLYDCTASGLSFCATNVLIHVIPELSATGGIA